MRALDLGWTWELISLQFHGQSSQERNDAAFTDPVTLAKRHRLGKNRDLCRDDSFRMHEAPSEVQDIWKPHMEHQFARHVAEWSHSGQHRTSDKFRSATPCPPTSELQRQ